jgi:intracellular multiplication protein IcmD
LIFKEESFYEQKVIFMLAMRTFSFLKKRLKKGLLIPALLLLTEVVLAQTGGEGIGKIASGVTESFSSIANLMLAIAYIAGIGFAVAAIFKFKQHKDNPTQVPLGTPIALLAIAISLVFLGAFIKPLGETIGAKETAGAKGTGGNIPGLNK